MSANVPVVAVTRRLEVGDVGTVIDHANRRGRRTRSARLAAMPGQRYENVQVVKVGRRWAHVEPSWLGRFDVETGEQDGGQYASSATFYTPERLAHREAMERANRIIQAHGLSFRLGARWPDEDVLALAEWLDGQFGGTVDDASSQVATSSSEVGTTDG